MKQVLVDTSVWVDHFKRGNDDLVHLLAMDAVLVHPLVIGEISCGTPPDRQTTLVHLENLQHAKQATVKEAMAFIEQERLYGLGCGLVDLLLLASTLITPDASFWTIDKRLAVLAERFGVLYMPSAH